MATNPFPSESQSITYTMFDKVKTITQDNRELTYDYGYDHQRIKMEESINGTTTVEKDYYGNCEIVHKNGNILYTYLSGPLGTFAVVRRMMNCDQISFIFKDHLGSWTAIAEYDGGLEQELSFDAWGNLRDPETWSGEFEGTPLLDRGFTGHEHLYNFGLINMNGRMYDPVMSSFLSVDNYVQQPDNSQNFNRYAYCLNNPLKYTDPSGECVFEAVMSGVIMGVMSSCFMIMNSNINRPIDITTTFLIGAASGAIGGLAGYGAGCGASLLLSDVGIIPGALTGSIGGFAGGFAGASSSAWMYGASFGDGLLAGLKSGAWGALGGMLIGGIQGGINAFDRGGDILTGKINDNVIIEYLAGGKGTKVETDYNNSMAAKYNDEWLHQKTLDRMKVGIGDVGVTKNTTTLNSNNPLVKKYSFATTGQYLKENGDLVNAFRCSDMSGGSEIHVSPGCLYASDMEFDATVGHEWIHAYHHYKIKDVSTLYTERVAHEYSYNVYQSNGFYTTAQKELMSSIKLGYGPGAYPAEYVIPSKYPFSLNYRP